MSIVEDDARNWVALMSPAVELAKHVSETAFVPKGLRGNPPAIVAAIMYGDEVGLGPMQALAKIAVIDGRPSLSAEAQRALILAAGHDIWVVESSNTKVTVSGRRSNSEHTSTITWTLDDAKRAGLAGRQNWRSYPRQMLMARATAELARLIFADAVGGLLATEELEDGEVADDNGEVQTTSKRKRRSSAQPETTQRVGTQEPPTQRALPPLPGDGEVEQPATSSDVLDDEPEAPASGGEPTPPDGSPAEPPATGNTVAASTRDKPATEAQKKKLNVLVGKLRDYERITTEHLWRKLAGWRSVDVTTMIDLYPDAYTEDGVLHWSPLRESLTRAEANTLIDALEGMEG